MKNTVCTETVHTDSAQATAPAVRRAKGRPAASTRVAASPEELARIFFERANAGDIDGLVALYEEDAVLKIGPEEVPATGRDAIRAYYAELLANGPRIEVGDDRPSLRFGELALTSSRRVNGMETAEIARRQPDGSWLWIIDQPAVAL